MLDNLVTSEDIASSIDKRLAVFVGDHLADVVLVLLKQILVFEHVADTCGDRNLLPCLESIFGASDGLFEFSLSGLGHFGDDVLGQRANYINEFGGFAVHPLSVDVVFVDLNGEGAFVLVEHLYQIYF